MVASGKGGGKNWFANCFRISMGSEYERPFTKIWGGIVEDD